MAAAADLSGTWHLNTEKSKWGKRPAPQNVVITIDHKEPSYKYAGRVETPSGNDARDFAFTGTIDGKEYPVTDAYGPGMRSVKRVNDRTIESFYKSNDGKATETARTTVSRDGKTMMRELTLKTPEGTLNWTEVYDRR
jgi:hypothetical protein